MDLMAAAETLKVMLLPQGLPRLHELNLYLDDNLPKDSLDFFEAWDECMTMNRYSDYICALEIFNVWYVKVMGPGIRKLTVPGFGETNYVPLNAMYVCSAVYTAKLFKFYTAKTDSSLDSLLSYFGTDVQTGIETAVRIGMNPYRPALSLAEEDNKSVIPYLYRLMVFRTLYERFKKTTKTLVHKLLKVRIFNESREGKSPERLTAFELQGLYDICRVPNDEQETYTIEGLVNGLVELFTAEALQKAGALGAICRLTFRKPWSLFWTEGSLCRRPSQIL